jgi:hypothetical protein
MLFPLLRQPAGVITFRIGDLGFVLRTPTLRAGSRFRIEINKAQIKNVFPIPQSAFRNPKSQAPYLRISGFSVQASLLSLSLPET